MDSGRRCGTPPMKNHAFCYYHRRLHETFVLPGHRYYEMPPLDNPHSIQLALTHLGMAVSKGLIRPKEAGTLAYVIQLSQNMLKHASAAAPAPEDSQTDFTPAMRKALRIEERGTRKPINKNQSQDDVIARYFGTDTETIGTESDVVTHTTENADELVGVRHEPNQPITADATENAAGNSHHTDVTPPQSDSLVTDEDFTDDDPPRVHPLSDVIGLTPVGVPSGSPESVPAWYPVAVEEIDELCEGLPKDGIPVSGREKYCSRRLALGDRLRDNPNPTTMEIMKAVMGVEAVEKESIQNARAMKAHFAKNGAHT